MNKEEHPATVFFRQGEFSKAEILINEYLSQPTQDSALREQLRYELELMKRIRLDFSKSSVQVRSQLLPYFPELNDSLMEMWERNKQLEVRTIDGEKHYFVRAVSNFFRLNKEAKKRREARDGQQQDAVALFQKRWVPQAISQNPGNGQAFDQRRIKVSYTISLPANTIPVGETVRCWMPVPRIGTRNSQLELLYTSESNYQLAPETQPQRSIYMEKQTERDSATVFHVQYTYMAAAQWFDLRPEKAQAYDTSTELYRQYTAERPPHIHFSPELRALAQRIVGAEKNPIRQVALLFNWMNDNIPWAGALEYSIIPNIPQYVLEHKRGDCGMQTFLFLSMARSLGIPAKWQSGWYLLPEEKNLHDWAEVYYQGIGWVPVDPSFKLVPSFNDKVRNFYLQGLDSYRLVVNDDYAQELSPAKEYFRSEPLDFQRGELEWRGGNLYFNQWKYNMQVEYID